MNGKGASIDEQIALLAARQHGIVASRQMRALGIERGAVETRLARGSLHRVHQGVYAVGHGDLDMEAEYMAAVIAGGAGALLSHASAASLWGLMKPIEGPIHVTIPRRSGRRRRARIRWHHTTTLEPADLTRRFEIPVTSVSRTLLDLDGTVEPRLYRRAVREAQHRRIKLDPRIRADRTRSDLESDFLAFCRRHRLPLPEVNLRVGRPTVDFVWPAIRLAVETDSYEYHHGEVAFEGDHARDLYLRRRGLTVLRYTGRQLEEEEALVLEELRRYIPVMKGLG
jgi:very-short-patch-repair endonuclease